MSPANLPGLHDVIEDVLVSHPTFGDSTYIKDQFVVCQRRRLGIVAGRLGSAKRLSDALERAGKISQYSLLGNTVVRCAILHAHEQVVTNERYGLPLGECESIFEAALQYCSLDKVASPFEYKANPLPRLGARPWHGWIWSDEYPNDIFGRIVRRLVRENYGDLPSTPSSDEVAALVAGAQLLHELVPDLASSALGHVQLIACVPCLGNWRDIGSSSQFRLGGTIFLSQQCLHNPWWAAEHLLHEALHQKLYDFRHGHTVIENASGEPGSSGKEPASVWSPWNPENLSRSNYWDTHRTLAAFHVYVHLALLSGIADHRASALEGIYGPRRGMIVSRKALDRARYLGEQLEYSCSDELGFAGRKLVDWLKAILDSLDPSPAPVGTYFHLVLDLFDKERRKVDEFVRANTSLSSNLHRRLGDCTKEEVESFRVLLTRMDETEVLGQFDRQLGAYADADVVTRFCSTRKLIATTLSSMSPNGYALANGSRELDSDDLVRQMIHRASRQLFLTLTELPDAVVAAKQRAEAFAFHKSCLDPVGRLLGCLSAAVRQGGRILEIGTGVGVGTAWISAALSTRHDVEVMSVEIDQRLSEAASSWSWPSNVTILTADIFKVVQTCGTFDLVFADAVPSKYEYIDATIKLVRPGGFLVVDDLRTKLGRTEPNERKDTLRNLLLHHRDLRAVELDWSSGVILAVVNQQ